MFPLMDFPSGASGIQKNRVRQALTCLVRMAFEGGYAVKPGQHFLDTLKEEAD